MPMRPARKRHLSVEFLAMGLEALEARRVLDGSSCTPACEDLIEITRLDGAESVWVRADDPEYGVVDCDDADQPGSDADLYSFTSRLTSDNQRDEVSADGPGDDHDLYDFGQDRGELINDDGEYGSGDEPAGESSPVSDQSDVPADAQVSQPEQNDATIVPELLEPAAIAPIALIPGSSKITWIGAPAVAPAIGPAADQPAAVASPASWTDLGALADPVIAAQP